MADETPSPRPSGDSEAIRVPAPDVAHDAHLHHSAAEQEALSHRDWWPVRVPELLAALVVLCLVVGVTIGVVLRVAGEGVLGLVELASLSMLLIVVLGAASLSDLDEHVRLELIDAVAGQSLLRFLDFLGGVIQLVVVGVVVYALQDLFRSDLATGTTTGGELDLKRSWLSGSATVGFALVGLVLVRQLIRGVLNRKKAT